MSASETFDDVEVRVGDDHVALVEIRRPPNNFFSHALIASLVAAFRSLDDNPACRVALLCSEGKHFCAGADFAGGGREEPGDLYAEAVKLFATRTPAIACVQGAAIGGGLGLALFADFRVACPEARFSANFARLGFHQGFGLSVTLPRLVGQQAAMEVLYTGRRIPGEEAHSLGLCDRLVSRDEIRDEARAMAQEIAASAPLAVDSIRQTLRGGLPEEIRRATARELEEQVRLQKTKDFREGIRATAERRLPAFQGH